MPRVSGLADCRLRPGVLRPVLGEVSPHPLRRALYALGDPALAVAARLLPGVLTTTRAIGNCMLHLVRMEGARPSTIDNAAIARSCD